MNADELIEFVAPNNSHSVFWPNSRINSTLKFPKVELYQSSQKIQLDLTKDVGFCFRAKREAGIA